jgi:hypothetical protein
MFVWVLVPVNEGAQTVGATQTAKGDGVDQANEDSPHEVSCEEKTVF